MRYFNVTGILTIGVSQPWHGSCGNWNFPVTFAYLIYTDDEFLVSKYVTQYYDLVSDLDCHLSSVQIVGTRHFVRS